MVFADLKCFKDVHTISLCNNYIIIVIIIRTIDHIVVILWYVFSCIRRETKQTDAVSWIRCSATCRNKVSRK